MEAVEHQLKLRIFIVSIWPNMRKYLERLEFNANQGRGNFQVRNFSNILRIILYHDSSIKSASYVWFKCGVVHTPLGGPGDFTSFLRYTRNISPRYLKWNLIHEEYFTSIFNVKCPVWRDFTRNIEKSENIARGVCTTPNLNHTLLGKCVRNLQITPISELTQIQKVGTFRQGANWWRASNNAV